jgi:hypothetical protein
VTPWKLARVAVDGTHHVVNGAPLYTARFFEVLAFHEPGLAPACDASGAYHIDLAGQPAYGARYLRTFGFYEGLAAVHAEDGWHHGKPDGTSAYAERYAWCGNYQGGCCTVRDRTGGYLHLDENGRAISADRWRYAGDYRDGIAVVQRDDGLHTHVDRGGRLLHRRWFLDLDVFHKGFARARLDDGWTHVDRVGQPVYTRRFAMIEPFYNGQARIEREDGGLEVIDEQGATILELRPARRDEFAELSREMVGFWQTETIALAASLGVMDALPESLDAIAAQRGLSFTGARRLLHALGELGLVVQAEGAFALTAKGAYLRADHPLSLRDAALVWTREQRSAWPEAARAVRARRREQPCPFEVLAKTPEDVAHYHRAMRSYATHDYASLGAVLDADHEVLLDAGGGTGALVNAVLQTRTTWRAVLLDRPEVVALARIAPAVRDRVELRAASLFEPWPARADAIVLARVLHDWPDEDALLILRRAREALAPGGRVYVVEMLRPEHGYHGALLDLHMLVVTGGRERTETEFAGLLAEAGLSLCEVRTLPAVSSVLVAEAA